jgi:mono/diheme cytochrome c family protein
MGAFRGYDDATRASLAAHVRGLGAGAPPALSRKAWQPASGSASRGEALYGALCAGCHGPRGEGRDAPGIGTAAFLQIASDAFLRATIVRGRLTSGMPAFGSPSSGLRALSADEVADVVAFVRSFSVSMAAAAEPAPSAAPPGAGPPGASSSPSGSP